MLFRFIILVLICICCLAITTSCTKEALTPCRKPPDTGNTSAQTSSNTNTNSNNNNNGASRTNKSLTANGETQYYIDPKDGKYKVVPDDPNQLPKDTAYLAVDDEGNLVQTDVNGIPFDSQAMTDKAKTDKEIARAKLGVKADVVDGAAQNIKAANELLDQQFHANQTHADVLTEAQIVQANTEEIVADQQQRVAFQQANMSNMIYELRLSTNEAEQAAAILKQAAKTAMAKANKAMAPAPGPDPFVSAPAPAPGADVNVCRSDEKYGTCSNNMMDPNRIWVATMRNDGDFVITLVKDINTVDGSKYTFSTDTKGKGKPPYRMYLLQDGNLTLYDASNTALWISGTSNVAGMTAPYRTKLESDGTLLVLDAGDRVIWSSKLSKDQKKECKSDVLGGLCSKLTNSTTGARVLLQDDGDLVFFKPGLALDAKEGKVSISKTAGKGKAPHRLYLTKEGRLVIYDADNTNIWSSPADLSTPNPPYTAIVRDTDLLVVDAKNNHIWNNLVGSIYSGKAV